MMIDIVSFCLLFSVLGCTGSSSFFVSCFTCLQCLSTGLQSMVVLWSWITVVVLSSFPTLLCLYLDYSTCRSFSFPVLLLDLLQGCYQPLLPGSFVVSFHLLGRSWGELLSVFLFLSDRVAVNCCSCSLPRRFWVEDVLQSMFYH